MKLDELRTKYREGILAVAQKHGAENIRVFGSVVRGEAAKDSDIDFLVHMKPGRTLLDRGGLYYDLEQLLSCKVDVISDKAVKEALKEKVFAEAIPL